MQGNMNQWKKMELESSSEMHFLATRSEVTVILQYIPYLQATATDTVFHNIRTPPKKRTNQQFCPFCLPYNK